MTRLDGSLHQTIEVPADLIPTVDREYSRLVRVLRRRDEDLLDRADSTFIDRAARVNVLTNAAYDRINREGFVGDHVDQYVRLVDMQTDLINRLGLTPAPPCGPARSF
jgi:hypothetical protein